MVIDLFDIGIIISLIFAIVLIIKEKEKESLIAFIILLSLMLIKRLYI